MPAPSSRSGTLVPALQANAMYEGKYPLVSALSRPVIVEHLVASARRHGADAVGHGCTGKGNDQVRFEVSSRILAPDLDVLAPVRVWGLTRADCIDLAAKWDIPIEATKEKLYSIDENMWGRAIECGVLENPWSSAPEEPYTMTRNPADAPAEPCEVVIGFERGAPVSIDGKPVALVDLIEELGTLVGSYGWGRVDMVENRRVGIKSREVYECPASLALMLAHQDLEGITLERDVAREKQRVEIRVGRADLRRPLALAADERAAGVRDRDPEGGHGRGSPPPAVRAVPRRRPARAAWPLRPRPRDLRRRRRVPPRRLRRVRAVVGPVGPDVVAPPGPGERAQTAGPTGAGDQTGRS